MIDGRRGFYGTFSRSKMQQGVLVVEEWSGEDETLRRLGQS